MSENDDGQEETSFDRTDLFAYLTAPQRSEYRAIMDLFTGPLLTDLSAIEVAQQLVDRGVHISIDDATSRCDKLRMWGNLVRGVRDARVPTVRDFLRSRSRYQASKLGGRVHRDAEAVLAAGEGAQEVARELLGAMVELLDRILARLAEPAPDAELFAADVTTVFNNQQLFNESVRDFYAYLNAVLSRYDLAGEEYRRFKELLLEYIDLITADVSRHTPAIVARCERLMPRLDLVIGILDSLPVLMMPDGTLADRLPGRHRSDWEQLYDWYSGQSGRSGPETLRSAANQALRQLLTNAKRMLAAAGTGISRRGDLLKLAGWFGTVDDGEAHRLFAATFGTYPARHLFGGPEEHSARDGVNTSWWDATPVEVPVSLRDRGDRNARGRTAAVPDPGMDQEQLLREAEIEARARQAAADELVAAGALHGAQVSPAARDLLLDLVGALLARHQDPVLSASVIASDVELEVTAESMPGGRTAISASDGMVIVHDLRLAARRPGRAAARPGRTA